MRRAALLLLAAAAGLATGCGGADNGSKPPPPRIRITLDSPRDTATVSSGSVVLRGTVSPAAARVRVGGSRAAVSSGRFRAEVALDVGTNVIDVMAEARNRSPAFASIRVTRQPMVEVPDLAGETADQAKRDLSAAGLKTVIRRKGGFFEEIVPRSVRVCGTDPAAGEKAVRGGTVEVTVGRLC